MSMRLKLFKGKQQELILSAKGELSWNQLSKLTNTGSHYLSTELKNETRLLSEKLYAELCRIAKKSFDNYIEKKYDDNWGRSKGGNNSPGSTLKITIPKKDERLAEFIGAVLGDGNISCYKEGSKIRVYQVKIAGDYNADREYHCYLKNISEKLFGLKVGEVVIPKNNERFLVLSSKKLVEFLIGEGLKAGDKIKNQITIPPWILKDRDCLRACIRGLIDTDGSIFRMSKRDSNLIRISFTNYNKTLLNDARNAFIALGFSPTRIIQNKRFFISKQSEIRKYLKEVGFSNKKHRDRSYKFFHSPVV